MEKNDDVVQEIRAFGGWQGSPEVWLDAAYETLIGSGIDNVRILHLAKKLGLSRTSFYWFFKNRDELLAALLQRWQNKNTGGLRMSAEMEAADICEAVLNVSSCWMEEEVFDSELEFAVRSWGLSSDEVLQAVQQADAMRFGYLKDMFLRHGFTRSEADIRARTLYQTQIGYISMRLHLQECLEERRLRIVDYAHVFSGQIPVREEVEAFFRHRGWSDIWTKKQQAKAPIKNR